jgi:hypothetical protein
MINFLWFSIVVLGVLSFRCFMMLSEQIVLINARLQALEEKLKEKET